MILTGIQERDLVYVDGNGIPRLRKCIYSKDDQVVTLAYPPNYCDSHTSAVYPLQDRSLWDMSTLKYAYSPDSLCLGNEGTVMIAWPDGCWCGTQYDEASDVFTDGIWSTSTAFTYNGVRVVAMAIATRADNSQQGRFGGSDPFVRYRNGVAGAVVPNSDIAADDFVFKRPDFTGVNIPDEFGYGQVSGGSSHAYVSGKILVEVPAVFGIPNDNNMYVRMYAEVNVDGTHRPSRNFIDSVIQNPLSVPHSRIAKTWADGGRWLALIDVLYDAPVLPPTDEYLHLFCPYVFFKDLKQERTTMEYWIRDMALSVRLVDSIRIGAT